MTASDKQTATVAEAVAVSALPDHPKVSDAVIFNPPPAVVNLIGPGAFRTDDHRYYFNGQGPVPGVTSVLDVLMKWDLVNWKVKSAVELTALMLRMDGEPYAFTDLPELTRLVKIQIDEKRDRQAKTGTGVHLLADLQTQAAAGNALAASEMDSKAGLVPDAWIPYLDAYRGFLGRYSASSIVSSEKMVWSAAGYGGTYDFLMRLDAGTCPGYSSLHGDPCLWLIDVKTAKGAYPENGLQLAAYRWADGIILPNDPKLYPMPVIHHTGLLHLRPDLYTDTGWRLIEYPTTVDDDYMGFLGALAAYEWRSKKRFLKSGLNTVK